MASFDANTLGELRDVREVAIRTEKHPQSAVVIWVVVADDAVFVRSVRGSKGRWYSLATGGSPYWSLPAADCPFRPSRRTTPIRSRGRAANS